MKSLNLKNKRLITLAKTWWTKVVYLIMLVCLFYLAQFLYQNFYQTILAAQQASYEQIIKQQTANIGLWNKIKTHAETRKELEIDTSELKNPFK